MRRGLWEVILVPVAVSACIGVLMLGVQFYTSTRSVLNEARFEALWLGEPQQVVEQRLPRFELDDVPDDVPPAGASCRYYRTTARYVDTVYRLCFTDGSLSAKDIVRTAR